MPQLGKRRETHFFQPCTYQNVHDNLEDSYSGTVANQGIIQMDYVHVQKNKKKRELLWGGAR